MSRGPILPPAPLWRKLGQYITARCAHHPTLPRVGDIYTFATKRKACGSVRLQEAGALPAQSRFARGGSAVGAQAGEDDQVTGDAEALGVPQAFRQVRLIRHFGVENLTALRAAQVVVRVAAQLVAVRPVGHGHVRQLAALCQQVQVAVDGGARDVRMLFAHFLVHL